MQDQLEICAHTSTNTVPRSSSYLGAIGIQEQEPQGQQPLVNAHTNRSGIFGAVFADFRGSYSFCKDIPKAGNTSAKISGIQDFPRRRESITYVISGTGSDCTSTASKYIPSRTVIYHPQALRNSHFKLTEPHFCFGHNGAEHY